MLIDSAIRAPLFPNLREMSLTTSNMHRMFMSSSVTSLSWRISPQAEPATIWPHVRAIADRMPNITVLKIDCIDIQAVDQPIAYLLSMLENLREFSIPIYSFTRDIVCALSSLPNLRNVDFNNSFGMRSIGQWPPLHALEHRNPSSYHFSTDPFQMIDSFSFSFSQLSRVNMMLTTKLPILSRLTRLAIRVPSYEDEAGDFGLLDFCNMVSHNATHLTSLTLWLTASGRRPPRSAYHARPPSLESMLPLTTIPSLTHLMFEHTLALAWTDANMDQFARALPGIRVLMLNHHPVVGSTPAATLLTLSSFATHCNELQELGLMLNATNADTSISYPTFNSRLQCLKLGRSAFPRDHQILERSSVSFLFSKMLPSHVTITAADNDGMLDCADHVFRPSPNRSIIPSDHYDQHISISDWTALHHLSEIRQERFQEVENEKTLLKERISELQTFLHAYVSPFQAFPR